MSLEGEAPVAEAPASGQETAPAPQTESNAKPDRYQGIIDMDATEPVEAKPEAAVAEELETEGDDVIEGEIVESDPWDGYEDFEFEGETVKIPSKLKDGYLRQADYTRKTQEVAARAKELETREQQIVQRQQLSDGEIDAYVALSRVGEQIKEFEGIDWNAELAKARAADDPIALTDLNAKWAQFQGLRSLQQEGVAWLDNAAKQRTEMAQQETAKRLAATKAFAEKNIKGWNPELDTKITNWAIQQGFDRDTLVQAYNPQVYSVLHKAFLWDQSSKTQQTARPSPQISAPVTPTKTVSAKANPQVVKDPESMSMSEYAAWRNAGRS